MVSKGSRVHARRSFLRGAAAAAAAGLWGSNILEALPQNVNTNSKPSDLRITDLRVAVVSRAPMTSPIIRIDTNQGIYGLGEVRDGASKNYALMLKSRLMNENPCNVDKVFRKIKQFGGHSRQAGGVCGVEMALWDLAGKAYNVPVYQMLGGKFRDKIRCYADTPQVRDPKAFGLKMKERREQGFTWLKMDLGVELVANVPGTVTMPLGTNLAYGNNTQHMFTGMEVTDKGIELLADYVAQVREGAGMDVPLSADHFGHIGVNSCIRLGKALQKYNLSWLEDMIPWQYPELLKKISDAVDIPLATGEDIYLKEPFIELCRSHAVDIIQPDLATSGGILETKKIGDAAQELGVPMALHMAGTPIACMASVHCAAATENFLVMENHSVDIPWWSDLVEGVEKPVLNKGFVTVPSGPGLGITLN
ncbi:MAG: mandelate racemase/muconate lactonizing enzyme family protein, partial [Candidatus Solibacter sp.]